MQIMTCAHNEHGPIRIKLLLSNTCSWCLTAGGADSYNEPWQEWDPCVSLFDGHVSPDMASNLEYMWQNYGFYLPDAAYLTDAEGLLKYLVWPTCTAAHITVRVTCIALCRGPILYFMTRTGLLSNAVYCIGCLLFP